MKQKRHPELQRGYNASSVPEQNKTEVDKDGKRALYGL
jgi:hypothetical protein